MFVENAEAPQYLEIGYEYRDVSTSSSPNEYNLILSDWLLRYTISASVAIESARTIFALAALLTLPY